MKKIPIESVIILQNALDELPLRSRQRRELVEESARAFGVSTATVWRALRSQTRVGLSRRADFDRPRVIEKEDLHRYCTLIAALKLRTSNKKGRRLSTAACIDILENHGVVTPTGIVRAPAGKLKRTTVERYMKRWRLAPELLALQPPPIRFQAERSNECWQFDFSPSDLKRIKGTSNKQLMFASVIDDRSGAAYMEYCLVRGEDTMTALQFLFRAMSPKPGLKRAMQGIPKMLYTDNGPVFKSRVFQNVMRQLDVVVQSHKPPERRRNNARAKGKVERPFRTVKTDLETLYHFHAPKNLKEANRWLSRYLVRYNDKLHRTEAHSRMEDWRRHLPPEGFREMCSWDRFCAFSREPEERSVPSDAQLKIDDVLYQLSPELAGEKVLLLHGVFDRELRVEYRGRLLGPFYPAGGPIAMSDYRPRAPAMREVEASDIEKLADSISVPRSVLSGSFPELVDDVDLIDDPPRSVPFPKEPLEPTHFENAVQAKLAIAEHLGRPLAQLSTAQLDTIAEILSESLEKTFVMDAVRSYFSVSVADAGSEGDP